MDLRTFPTDFSAVQCISKRRKQIEKELGIDLNSLSPRDEVIGSADEKNCEQMFGMVPIPVGYAGPLKVRFSSGEVADIHLPLATTEGALVASANRGCKALSAVGGVKLSSIYRGMTRSLAFKSEIPNSKPEKTLRQTEAQWKTIGESTSSHLKIINSHIDIDKDHLFLTIDCDTHEAMGMNMVTIAASAIGKWVEENISGLKFITVAGNVDSDKKPSKRTHDLGRGYEVTAKAYIPGSVIESILKTTPEAMLAVAEAKLVHGSKIAGAIGANLHAANLIAALYLATGQDAAHVVEGSLADTTVTRSSDSKIAACSKTAADKLDSLKINIRLPAILVGVRGGGTTLPAQAQCLQMLLKPKTSLRPTQQLAESIAAGVLAGELSLLAAQASHTLAKAHRKMGR